MIDLALMLTAEGMSVVFVVLSILAFFMWVMGKLAGKETREKIELKATFNSDSGFSDKEIFAITAAIMRHEGVQVVDVKVPKNWKNAGRFYAMRWGE